jgi:hypothetical protein
MTRIVRTTYPKHPPGMRQDDALEGRVTVPATRQAGIDLDAG